jgi:hypothetical protein
MCCNPPEKRVTRKKRNKEKRNKKKRNKKKEKSKKELRFFFFFLFSFFLHERSIRFLRSSGCFAEVEHDDGIAWIWRCTGIDG